MSLTKSSLQRNLADGAGQLAKAPAKQKWVAIHCPNNKKAELEQPDYKKVIDAFVARGNRGRFVMTDGVKEV